MKVPVRKFQQGGRTQFVGNGVGSFGTGASVGTERLAGKNERLDQQVKELNKGEADADAIGDAVGEIPVIGGFFSAGKSVTQGVGNLIDPPDKYGFNTRDYLNASLSGVDLKAEARTAEAALRAEQIGEIDRAGANVAFQTPKFQSPAFGRFGMKFKKFN